jgi:nucleoside-diphosphate-sugar epimerase
MQTAIIGSSGFVGSNLRTYLKNKTFQIDRSNLPLYLEGNFRDIYACVNLIGIAHDLKKTKSYSDYYVVNTELLKKLFDQFLCSNQKVFITLSSVKAVADEVNFELTEEILPNPITHYGKSKLLAEQYMLSHLIPEGKRVYILRPCMIHGPGNKGNLNILYKFVSKGLPWPLGSYTNYRSYLSIDNLCFIIGELIERKDIPSGVYNVADDVPLSTNEVISMIAESKGKRAKILNLNTKFIKLLARAGDFLKIPLNTERLQKLTESYIVSNAKIKNALGKPLPLSSKEGLFRTFQSFAEND